MGNQAVAKPKTSDDLLRVEWLGCILHENHGHLYDRYVSKIPLKIYKQNNNTIGCWFCDNYGIPCQGDVVQAGYL